MKLGGKHTASPNDWKSLWSLRLFKPSGLLPPFLSLFLPFLAVPFLHPFFSAAAASGRGFHAALMPQEEERWSLPSSLTTVPPTSSAAGCQHWTGIIDTELGWDLESQQLEGHLLSAATPKSLEVLGFFTSMLGKMTHSPPAPPHLQHCLAYA